MSFQTHNFYWKKKWAPRFNLAEAVKYSRRKK